MRSWLSRVSLFRASAAAVQDAVWGKALPEAAPAMAEMLEQRRLLSAAAGDTSSLPQAALAAVNLTTSVADVSGTYEGTFKARVDGQRRSVGFTLTITQSASKLTGQVRAGPLNVKFVGVVRKNQFKLALDGSPAAGFIVGRVGRNGEKLGGTIVISDGGQVYTGKFA